MITPDDMPIRLEVAREVCTEREMEVLRLRLAGWSMRRIALYLGISRSSVRERMDNAARKIVWDEKERT